MSPIQVKFSSICATERPVAVRAVDAGAHEGRRGGRDLGLDRDHPHRVDAIVRLREDGRARPGHHEDDGEHEAAQHARATSARDKA